MPARFHRYCRERGCSERHNDASGFCSKHRENNSIFLVRKQRDAERKKGDPIWHLYNCAAWPRFRGAFFGYGNVICQRIVDGQRCRFPVEILHHIHSPRQRPDLMYSPSNVRGVCRQHHPNSEGEPKENLAHLGDIYAPTLWREIRFT